MTNSRNPSLFKAGQVVHLARPLDIWASRIRPVLIELVLQLVPFHQEFVDQRREFCVHWLREFLERRKIVSASLKRKRGDKSRHHRNFFYPLEKLSNLNLCIDERYDLTIFFSEICVQNGYIRCKTKPDGRWPHAYALPVLSQHISDEDRNVFFCKVLLIDLACNRQQTSAKKPKRLPQTNDCETGFLLAAVKDWLPSAPTIPGNCPVNQHDNEREFERYTRDFNRDRSPTAGRRNPNCECEDQECRDADIGSHDAVVTLNPVTLDCCGEDGKPSSDCSHRRRIFNALSHPQYRAHRARSVKPERRAA